MWFGFRDQMAIVLTAEIEATRWNPPAGMTHYRNHRASPRHYQPSIKAAMKPLHATVSKISRCPCCSSKHRNKKNNSGKSASRQKAKREMRRELHQ